MIRVLIADDETMIRTAMETLLAMESDLEIVASVTDGRQAVAAAQEHRPDICILDLEMPHLDGVEAAREIARSVATKVIMCTRHARPGVLRRALAEKVAGFVPKSTPVERLADVIREVMAGRRYVDPDIAATALTAAHCPLTDRELDVVRTSRQAASVSEIADHLNLAYGTVRNYLSTAMQKLGVSTRAEASQYAWEQGWI